MEPPFLFSPVPELTPAERFRLEKEDQIKDAIGRKDLIALQRLAKTKGGLVTDALRRQAWPILLGCDVEPKFVEDWTALPPHPDEDQAQLDVNRAFVYYPEDVPDAAMTKKREELWQLIVHVLRKHPRLSYYQGYHDVCQVVYLVFGLRRALPVLEYLTLFRLRDFTMPSLQPAMEMLQLIPPLIGQIDRPLAQHLALTSPVYALSAMITLFAHDVQTYADIVALFDFFFAAEDASLPVYLYATIMVKRRDELLAFGEDEPEMLHAVLSRFPQPLPLDLNDALAMATALHTQYPPHTLQPGWGRVSPHSVLRTWRPPDPQEIPPPAAGRTPRRRKSSAARPPRAASR
ncbi:rab-GTPase-TBC domain-containing protein, partial [Dipodascopsis tothii]|uniref:rab-GTPase-TBC domain-containing protein n=1 Tax=Dipodascopsis tothii TaxID=44089 RepID=UPI0034CD20A9